VRTTVLFDGDVWVHYGFVFGLHTGGVPLVIEALAAEPSLVDSWEDVVEASLVVDDVELELRSFQSSVALTVPAPGSCRATAPVGWTRRTRSSTGAHRL
jgi:hypothetical protein